MRMYQMSLNVMESCLACKETRVSNLNETILRLTNETDEYNLEMTMTLNVIYIYECYHFKKY
jgi:hypothetical protein